MKDVKRDCCMVFFHHIIRLLRPNILNQTKVHLLLLSESEQGVLTTNDGGDGGDEAFQKINLYFTFECRSSVNLFSTPISLKTCSGLTRTDSVQFQKKIRKLSHCGLRSPKYIELRPGSYVAFLPCRMQLRQQIMR